MDPDDTSHRRMTIASAEKSKDLSETKPSTNPFKIEWSLFWDGLLRDHDEPEGDDPLKALTREQISKLIKDLSAQRKQLHKQIESVNKEIELNSAKLESLKLVGSEPEETLTRINQLNDQGEALSSELQKLNQKLQWVRTHEKEMGDKDWA